MPRVSRVTAAAILAAGLFGSLTATTASAATSPTPACTGVIQITQLAFDSTTVARGQIATAHLVARNCTAQTVTASLIWSGRFIGSTPGGIPPGCPVIDPIGKQVTFAPHGKDTDSLGYLIFPGCTATALTTTTTFDGPGGTVLATATAEVTITGPSSGT
ncbi:MAG TPA: hypothetical protein VH333_09650 [Pseudonocardiaceae bacterium]|jgi:hypothetical protein|nr:hypothetical protein [Pseudonocardiaceae bacterium]